MLNLCHILERSAQEHPTKVAVKIAQTSTTYSQLNKMANSIANGLISTGIKPQNKVAFACPNIEMFPVIYFGILKTGAVAVPISTMLKSEEIGYQLTNTNSELFLCFYSENKNDLFEFGREGFALAPKCKKLIAIPSTKGEKISTQGVENVWNWLDIHPDTFNSFPSKETDTAVIIHTSGTTGLQKGAELSHGNLFMNAREVAKENVANIQNHDHLLVALPLFHVFGQTVMMNAGILAGAMLVFMPKFDPNRAWRIFDEENITVFAAVPTMYWALLKGKREGINIQKIAQQLHTPISGGDSLPIPVFEGFKNQFGIKLIEGYGMTEGSPVVTFNHKNRPLIPGSIGSPLQGIEVKIVDDDGQEVSNGHVGELIFKGANVMKGYYYESNQTKATIKNNWLYSGDLATKDDQGNFYIKGRKKDLIIRSGLNVYPREVERVLMQHSSVSLASVIGIPNLIKGEEVKAFVILNKSKGASPDEIKDWVNKKIASYKCPKIVEIVESLPMNATGKVLKRALRESNWRQN